MEIGKQQYSSVMQMPVDRLKKYLKWKINYDREVAKAKNDKLGNIKI